jgi:hypothetical protein
LTCWTRSTTIRRGEQWESRTYEHNGLDSDEAGFPKGDEIMSAIPLEVTEETAAHIATLGMQHELELMLDWVRRNVAALQGIRVAMTGHCGWGNAPPSVLIWAYQTPPAEDAPLDLVEWDWGGWKAQTFPPQVCSAFTLMCTYQPFPSQPAEQPCE